MIGWIALSIGLITVSLTQKALIALNQRIAINPLDLAPHQQTFGLAVSLGLILKYVPNPSVLPNTLPFGILS